MKVHHILEETHKERNINLLKARDYYFNIARRLSQLSKVLICLPPLALLLSYLPRFSRIAIISDQRDLIIGAISALVFLLNIYVEKRISKHASISNMLRECYDCEVLGIPQNKLLYSEGINDNFLEKARKMHDREKYEVWYGEIFCDNKNANVLCCQMDNLIYTRHIYGAYKKYLLILPVILSCGLMGILFRYGGSLFLLSIVALFQLFQQCYEDFASASEQIEKSKRVTEKVHTMSPEDVYREGETFLRMVQDAVVESRENSLFVPRLIRVYYLKDNNPYYKELNAFRSKFLDHDSLTMPSKAEDVFVLSCDETTSVPLSALHDRLREMMQNVKTVFEEENIPYTLDGGTLIGAVRNEHYVPVFAEESKLQKKVDTVLRKNSKKRRYPLNPEDAICKDGGDFIFWDDDIDLAIPHPYLEKAKQAIRTHLSAYYEVQDYANDPYYSPRLSNFRIREKNKNSEVKEKDSELFAEYRFRGIFLDIYSYSPILFNLTADRFFRRMLIHPINRRIRKIERDYLLTDTQDQVKKKFLRLKTRYLKRVDWYLQHAKNDRYFVYVPNYIDNLSKAGPYIRKEALYGEARKATFAGMKLPIPPRPDEVLRGTYRDWYRSPFISKEKLEENHGEEWYSYKIFCPTVLKHIYRVDLLPNDCSMEESK